MVPSNPLLSSVATRKSDMGSDCCDQSRVPGRDNQWGDSGQGEKALASTPECTDKLNILGMMDGWGRRGGSGQSGRNKDTH